ncbi:MAG: hypothetical protein KF722_17045 [Nitrospira sp.]|jgi:hypothetical protein|nr:hypothetical protein [Nitrospira sp.]
MKRKIIILGVLLGGILASTWATATLAETGQKVMLIHLKTSLKHDDAQICVAYNAIWAALEQGLKVNVVVDADGVNTYKIGWFGKDSIQDYKLPERMREVLAKQLNFPLEKVPQVYGEYLEMLRSKGATFFINQEMLVTAGLGSLDAPLEKISVKWFNPVTMSELISLRTSADYYMAY